jgi:Xaa-Pro aminopeptidase
MVSGLIQLNILKGSIPELIEKGAYKPYYMHKTSHWLGLDVHDVGAYTMNGEARKLEEGMVFTVEPGLYIPATAEEVPLHFRGIGVRIEDDLLVTPDGIENLTDAIPTQTDEVEAWVRDS